MKHAAGKIPWRSLGELISQCEDRNSDLSFGINDVRGVTNAKGIIQTKASIDNRALDKFLVVGHHAFAFNRRVHDKLGLGFNESEKTFIFTNDYVAFRVKNEKELDPTFLYIYFCRDEFDREILYNAWGSATLFFNYEDMARVMIPVPSLPTQRKVVEVWRGLRKMKEENEALAAPLMQLCRSYLQDCKKKWPMKEIGPMISERNERNESGGLLSDAVRGLSTNKSLIETVANLEGVSLAGYKVVKPNDFAYVADTSRRGDKVSYGFNASAETFLVSSISTVFEVVATEKLSSEFLNLWLCRPEFDRYARFNSWGSARESFSFSDMCRVKIPLPPIEVQQAVVDVYRCASEAKKIAQEAGRLSRDICPALVRWAAEGGRA